MRAGGGSVEHGNGINGKGWLDSCIDVGYKIKESRMTKIFDVSH